MELRFLPSAAALKPSDGVRAAVPRFRSRCVPADSPMKREGGLLLLKFGRKRRKLLINLFKLFPRKFLSWKNFPPQI